jgi:hypothetical protein
VNGSGGHRARNIFAIVLGAIAFALIAATAAGAVIYFHGQATSAEKVSAVLADKLDGADTARTQLSGQLGEAMQRAQYEKGYAAGQSAG